MIKRALGIFADSDEDESIDAEQERKLHKKLVPGLDCSDSESDEDDVVNSEEEIADEVQPEVTFRGKFRCELCPEKVLISDQDLASHVLSKEHVNREKLFTQLKEGGDDAITAYEQKLAHAKPKNRKRKLRWHELDAGQQGKLRARKKRKPMKRKTKASVLKEGKTKTPVPTEEKTKTPVPTEKNTKTPVPTEKKTKPPVPTEKKTKTPVPTEKKTKTPVPTEKKTKTPVPTEKKTKTLASRKKAKTPVPP